MEYPAFMRGLPGIDTPFPEDAVTTNVVRSDAGLVVFFTVHKDLDVPEHSHGPQWGALFSGRVELTVEGMTRQCKPGDIWDIPAGTLHSARLFAGSRLMDIFAEPDRYPLKS
jgi:quercetin dioxygenase-like cupin family protein